MKTKSILNEVSDSIRMKTKTFTCILFFAYLACVTPVVAVAGQAANAYVTVKSDKGDITLSGDGMNFHLSPADGPVTIEVTANAPYILSAPNPNQRTISPHQTVEWEVRCEDGEIYGAEGTIGFCQYTIIPPPDIKHRYPPTITGPNLVSSYPSTNQQESPKKTRKKRVEITVGVVKPGCHQIIFKYKPCPICGKTPRAIENRKTWLDEFKWHRFVPTSDGDVVLPGNKDTFKGEIEFPVGVGMASIYVRGENKGCGLCFSVSGFLDIMAP